MASYKALVKDVIKKADVLLEIIDARFPDETRNSEVERDIVRLNKPFIIVINKCDLVSKEKLEETKARLSKIAPTIFISSKDRSGTTMLRHQILASASIKASVKGRDILVGTLGYPNVGKSSVINGVTGRHRAGTSPISGHTKGVQHVDAGSRIMFIDTPGVIPFDEKDEYLQGLLGIKDATHLKDKIGVALKIIEKMLAENKAALEAFYNITIENEISYDVLELIGKQCNFLQKKGEVDETRTATRIINDWQNGLLLI
ncbi:GTPase [Methanosarcina sp.]|uniref:GTPase n=1 Tax=Methanosarcina sp. TaxID=2213 RepID=UPI003C720CFD